MSEVSFDIVKIILSACIKAAGVSEKLREAIETPTKIPIRMFGFRGNPQAYNLSTPIDYPPQKSAIELHAKAAPR